MNAAVGRDSVVENNAIGDASAIDEGDDMRPQMALVIEYIAAQTRINAERCFECFAQRCRRSIDFRYIGKASQLLREDQPCHCGSGRRADETVAQGRELYA